MKRLTLLLFWACVGFSQAAGVVDFLNENRVVDPLVVVSDGQYQVFYKTDVSQVFSDCRDVDCVNAPQECR
jgi:hypothetical protein